MTSPGARALAAAVAVIAAGQVSCRVGEGSGEVHSPRLKAEGCFDGVYDLGPTFFASNPYLDTQMIRVQRRDDIIENSDGVHLLVSDTAFVRAHLGQPLEVGLPADVTPPGVPIVADPTPPVVQLTLYLHETCHGQNIALYAVSGTITFTKLFNGDRDETNADERLTVASFDVMVGDPREQPPGGGAIPEESLSALTGSFRFFFERAQPSQPFP